MIMCLPSRLMQHLICLSSVITLSCRSGSRLIVSFGGSFGRGSQQQSVRIVSVYRGHDI